MFPEDWTSEVLEPLCITISNISIYIGAGLLLAALYWVYVPWLAQVNPGPINFLLPTYMLTDFLRQLVLWRGDFEAWTPGENF